MSTATALKNRKKGVQTHEANIPLVLAFPEDFKISVQVRGAHGPTIVQKRRLGMIYWYYSFVKNEIEPTPHQITENTDYDQLKEYLDNKQVFIARNFFDKG